MVDSINVYFEIKSLFFFKNSGTMVGQALNN